MDTLTVVLVYAAIGLVVVVLSVFGINVYNALVQVRNNVEKAWKNIDVLLLQRYEELPKLVEAVESYMEHERELITQVTEMRTRYSQAESLKDKIQIENELSTAMTRLGHVWEGYPELESNETFLRLQERISAIESGIADRRELFNDSINIHNIQIDRFPNLLVARLLGYEKQPYLAVPERKTADFKLGIGAGSAS